MQWLQETKKYACECFDAIGKIIVENTVWLDFVMKKTKFSNSVFAKKNKILE